MATITMDNVAHRYPGAGTTPSDLALKPLNMKWEDGVAYALLGPSGCGKTTLLNLLSGLLVPSEGRISFDGRDVTHLPAQARNIAQVFQFPVIYDTMTVERNLAFPLRNRGVPETQLKKRVSEILELLGLTHRARERARNLSADDKQKISLGRGLVRDDANAILFDEPLTVIDPALKWELRAQLKQVHQRVGHTMIYVTHDQTEALTFADQVVVMLDGEVLQIGSPQALFEQPDHTFVGNFIGSPGMNLIPCTVSGSSAYIDGHAVPLNKNYDIAKGEVTGGVRPEHVTLVERAQNRTALPAEIERSQDLGRHRVLELRMANQSVRAIVPEGKAIPAHPAVQFHTDFVHVYQNDKRLKDGRPL